MSDLAEFARRIEEALAAAQRPFERQSPESAEYMRQFAERMQRFQRVSQELLTSVIRPRMELVARHFENAEVRPPTDALECVCWFSNSPEFPATAKLRLAIDHDPQLLNLVITYEWWQTPLFAKLDAHDKLVQPLDAVDIEAVAAWAENKLVQFIGTYFQVERDDDSQEPVLVTDPVCGMRLNRAAAAASEDYRGHAYYFCSPECARKFAASPKSFVEFKVM